LAFDELAPVAVGAPELAILSVLAHGRGPSETTRNILFIWASRRHEAEPDATDA
jgi:hypothetical protein